ncbi:MAG: hypothetical protein ACTSUE_17655 [Promethearchaeota archaeon]
MTAADLILLDGIPTYLDRNTFNRLYRKLKASAGKNLDVFEVKFEIKEYQVGRNKTLKVSLVGEDALAAKNYIALKHGCIEPLGYFKEQKSIHRAKVKEPRRLGFGIFMDVGISTGKDALFPVYMMQEQLLGKNKVSSRVIAKYFGFCDGFGLDVVVEKKSKGGKVEVRISNDLVEMFRLWGEDGLDRVLCHGETADRLGKLVVDAMKTDRHVMVSEHGFLDTIITCDARTAGAGIVSLVGSKLPHVKFSVFNGSKVREFMESGPAR